MKKEILYENEKNYILEESNVGFKNKVIVLLYENNTDIFLRYEYSDDLDNKIIKEEIIAINEFNFIYTKEQFVYNFLINIVSFPKEDIDKVLIDLKNIKII